MARSHGRTSGYRVGPGTWVRVRYVARDADGELVEDTAQESSYVHGRGVLLPALEAALENRASGDHVRVTLRPEDAFGPRRQEAILELDRDELPAEVAAGDRYEAETADGLLVVLRVLEVRDDAVVVDSNHPLAGQRITFEIDVLEVRPATDAELRAAERAAEGLESASGPLIPVASLLRGTPRRYERDGADGDVPPESEPP
ncbi:MAG TPA: FKBP-type peptidyl-prolyl cis-trans isomerase [Polyangiaceae bacterium]|nr:FKBP-type peptidyl-prolyl cis-trans isomerase [Polyangiaceae bacterium]